MAMSQGGSIKLPPFRILQANSKVFKAEDLTMGKPIVLIYFSPECEHCQTFLDSLFRQRKKLTGASIALITYMPMEKVAGIIKKYHLAKDTNIYVGTEGASFFVRDYYRISSIPFVALHKQNGDLIQAYQRAIPLATLIRQVRDSK